MDTLTIFSQQLHEMGRDFVALLPKLTVAIVVAALFMLAGGRLAVWAANRIKKQNGRSATNLLILAEKSFRILFVAIGLFLAFAIVVPSLSFGYLFAVLGIGSIALGFAFRDILQNFFAGIIILLNRTFEVGDRIASGGIDGVVEGISIRATVLRTDAGDRVIVPNALLMTREITHRFYTEKGKAEVIFHVPVDAHLGAVMRLVHEIFREMGTAVDPARSKVSFESMGERTISLRATWRTAQVGPNPRCSKEYFMTRLQEELHRHGAHLGILEEITLRSYDGGAPERPFSFTPGDARGSEKTPISPVESPLSAHPDPTPPH
jgi:small-conductance mechanosensitive channel